MSKSETWSETKTIQKLQIWKNISYIFLKLLFAYLFRSYLLPTDRLKSHTHMYLLHEKNEVEICILFKDKTAWVHILTSALISYVTLGWCLWPQFPHL